MIERRDITSLLIKDNDTWNDCPKCGKVWKDLIAKPGIIHRTRLCVDCYNKFDNDTNKLARDIIK